MSTCITHSTLDIEKLHQVAKTNLPEAIVMLRTECHRRLTAMVQYFSKFNVDMLRTKEFYALLASAVNLLNMMYNDFDEKGRAGPLGFTNDVHRFLIKQVNVLMDLVKDPASMLGLKYGVTTKKHRKKKRKSS